MEPDEEFDIVRTYQQLLAHDPDLTMPVAAIEALVETLQQHSSTTTISETLDLLARSTAQLKRSVANPISLSAGTDLFQRYLVNALQRPSAAGDFATIRAHLITHGRQFVTRAKASREKIAHLGRRFVRDGTTVLTNGGSRVVGALLERAAEDGAGAGPAASVAGESGASHGRRRRRRQPSIGSGTVRFRVVYVLNHDDAARSQQREGLSTIRALRRLGVPVATIPESAVAYALEKTIDMVIVGAEGVVENGGIISRLGTYQLAVLARAARKPFYVVAESHKFVRLYPLSQLDLGIRQEVVRFSTAVEGEAEEAEEDDLVDDDDDYRPSAKAKLLKPGPAAADVADAVDFTPPDLISALVTESGVMTPSAVSEELIRIWF
ncbi:MAG: translation initiation factor eIF-2B subunit alpha [Phylliscum demangeonii]|nr:MAG: translation initiation factor eIF-2B subunit alpha [Phylliscum demangeonii]